MYRFTEICQLPDDDRSVITGNANRGVSDRAIEDNFIRFEAVLPVTLVLFRVNKTRIFAFPHG